MAPKYAQNGYKHDASPENDQLSYPSHSISRLLMHDPYYLLFKYSPFSKS